MKAHIEGLGNFLNAVTTEATDKIIYVDIDEIESNPKNFYGLRNIDELASLIAVSHLIEPLTVIEETNGKYKLISGHRRRAAVQKLLEEGVYTERKLPCIVKTRKKLSIEQEDGETIEFDEEAVEMLNMIASNRGQREERTIDEKIQEVKYLEGFAKAIYNQKNSRKRGRFLNFFAEEILNISQTQLWRINALGKLTGNIRQAIDDKKISETAAVELSTMSEDKQEEYLEKILSGEMKGTVQEIQNLKTAKKEVEEENLEESVERKLINSTDSIIENLAIEPEINEKVTEKEEVAENLQSSSRFIEKSEESKLLRIIDVPEEFEDPQKEAEEWFYQGCLESYEIMYAEAKRMSEKESNELKAAQWGIRASVARYNIEELKLRRKKSK